MSDGATAMELKVGALVVVALAILIGFVVVLGDYSCSRRAILYVDFQNSGGLRRGAPVKISGVTVGKVADLQLWGGRRDKEHGNKKVQVRAVLSLSPKALALLHEDATFRVQTLGVLGEKYVEVWPGSEGRPKLSEGAVVDGAPPATLESLIAGKGATLMADLATFFSENRQNIAAILDNLKTITHELKENLPPTLVQARQALDKASRAAERADNILRSVEKALGDGRDVRATLAAARSISRSLERDVISHLAVAAKNAAEASAKAKELLDTVGPDVERAARSLRKTVQGLADGRGTIGALLQDKELYDDMIDLMKDLKRHPWKAIWKE